MITLNYIKQCEQSKEIQKQWSPKNGDLFAYHSDYLLSDTLGNYLGTIDKYDLIKEIYIKWHYIRDCGGITVPFKNFNKKEYIYLPNQSQLQEMNKIEENYRGSFIWQDIEEIDIMTFSIYKDNHNYLLSYEEIWICYVMWKNYNKKWNGKKWIKIK